VNIVDVEFFFAVPVEVETLPQNVERRKATAKFIHRF
jgi:hypothetical protein